MPTSQIKHTALETFEGLKALAFYLMNFLPSENNLTNISDTRYHYPIKTKHRLKNESTLIRQTNIFYTFVSFLFLIFL